MVRRNRRNRGPRLSALLDNPELLLSALSSATPNTRVYLDALDHRASHTTSPMTGRIQPRRGSRKTLTSYPIFGSLTVTD